MPASSGHSRPAPQDPQLVRQGIRRPAPLRPGRHPGDERPTPIAVIELDDVRRLLSTATGPDLIDRRDTAIIRVLLDTGARLGELVNMSGHAL